MVLGETSGESWVDLGFSLGVLGVMFGFVGPRSGWSGLSLGVSGFIQGGPRSKQTKIDHSMVEPQVKMCSFLKRAKRMGQ